MLLNDSTAIAGEVLMINISSSIDNVVEIVSEQRLQIFKFLQITTYIIDALNSHSFRWDRFCGYSDPRPLNLSETIYDGASIKPEPPKTKYLVVINLDIAS